VWPDYRGVPLCTGAVVHWNLPEPINEIAWFGYLSGWRRGEILPLRWDSVDRTAREVRLRTSKNGQGRLLPLDGELWDLIERRWAARVIEMKDDTTNVSEFVFHRRGEPVVDFRDPWTRRARKRRFLASCSRSAANGG
jgi:integrase